MDKHSEWRDEQTAKNYQELLKKVGHTLKVKIKGKEYQRKLYDNGSELFIKFEGRNIPVKVDEHNQVIARYYETKGR